ncbi:MAG: hypothetical protein ABI683_15265 [Ginsengibacter sp.]
MENSYSAYVRTVNDTTFYFVKKYQVFSEYKDVPACLDGYAMHYNFEKACKIAMVSNKAIQQQLMDELRLNPALKGVTKKQTNRSQVYKLRTRTISFPSFFKLSWLTKVS